MLVVDGNGIPIGALIESAQRAEVKLALATMDTIRIKTRTKPRTNPKKMVADKAYDAEWLRKALKARNIFARVPRRGGWKSQKKPTFTKALKRDYRERYKVERTISWFGAFRRLLIRWEQKASQYQAFFMLALVVVTLRRVLK